MHPQKIEKKNLITYILCALAICIPIAVFLIVSNTPQTPTKSTSQTELNNTKIESSNNDSNSKSSKSESETKLQEAKDAEIARHKLVLENLKAERDAALRKCESDIAIQKIGCTMTESDCNDKIEELDKKIAQLQTELNKIPTPGNSITGGSSGIDSAKRSQLIVSIDSLRSKKHQYTSILQKYKNIRSLESKKITIENDYTDAVLAECELHDTNMNKLK